MSRQDLTGFIHSVEHSYSLRMKIQHCKSPTEIIELANQYGFTINPNDLIEDYDAERVNNWFRNSIISPLKKY